MKPSEKSSETLQQEDDKIRSFFKTTTEPYDDLEWDGAILKVWLKDRVIEKYTFEDLREVECL